MSTTSPTLSESKKASESDGTKKVQGGRTWFVILFATVQASHGLHSSECKASSKAVSFAGIFFVRHRIQVVFLEFWLLVYRCKRLGSCRWCLCEFLDVERTKPFKLLPCLVLVGSIYLVMWPFYAPRVLCCYRIFFYLTMLSAPSTSHTTSHRTQCRMEKLKKGVE